jgi:DNA topoisomerase-3
LGVGAFDRALAMPEDYGFTGFKREHLPIISETFKLIPRQIKAENV